MKKVPTFLLASIVFAIMALPQVGTAEEFSLFGVKMGMSGTQIDSLWSATEEGSFIVPGSSLFNIQPEFDHRSRLYQLAFSVPIPLLDQYPAQYATTAFQQAIQDRWGSKDLTVTIRTGRGVADITVTSKTLQDEYSSHIKAQMQFHLQSVLAPSLSANPSQP